MPRNATVVRVFVASPSDVVKERETLETLIVELNRTWSETLGVILELVQWETHTRPGFGADPQAIINAQIGDTYDVFIGILWSRFGTPTPRALSGTLEEFKRAVERIRDGSPEIMIYFKDAPISPSKIDVAQLTLVTEFRTSISNRALYSLFEDAAVSCRCRAVALTNLHSLTHSLRPIRKAAASWKICQDHRMVGLRRFVCANQRQYEGRARIPAADDVQDRSFTAMVQSVRPAGRGSRARSDVVPALLRHPARRRDAGPFVDLAFPADGSKSLACRRSCWPRSTANSTRGG